ncbi:MAG TPA: hypothetical protein PKN80_04085 [bacterium]|nr:hypothetical protein [bacterium]HNS48951.1 hypothetical protein [bacterium]
MTSATGKSEPGRGGISLLEIVVGLAVMAALLWGTLPHFSGRRRSQRLEAAAQKIEGTVSLCRQTAISRRRPHEIVMETSDATLLIRDAVTLQPVGPPERLPEGVVIGEITGSLRPMVFRPDGSLSGVSGSIRVRETASGAERRVVVYGLTGQTRTVP